MKVLVCCALAALIPVTAQSAQAADRFGETCTGSEVVKVGPGRARTMPYELTLSVDLKAGRYCYGACGPDQTFAIADTTSDPIRLADLETGGQKRLILFAPDSGKLTDRQSYSIGPLGAVERTATAECRAATYRAVPPLRTAGS